MTKNLFIGIDFSKDTFDATLFHAEGLEKTSEPEHKSFANDKQGYGSLYRWVRSCRKGVQEDAWLFCGEDTGICSEGLSEWLSGKGIDIWIEMPYTIKHSMGLVRSKSDKADSALIAEYAWRHQDKATPYVPLSSSLKELREVFLMRQQLVRQKAALTVRKQCKELSARSKCVSFAQRLSKGTITFLDAQIRKCDMQIDRIIASDPQLRENYAIITSIKGISRQNGAALLVYTNNFTKFDLDARKIACYYGVAPFARQSGTSLNSRPHTSHMANKMLKAILAQAALAARRFEPAIACYYQRLIANGKDPQLALNNVKNKLLHIIVALVKNREYYDPERYFNYHNAAPQLNCMSHDLTAC